VWTIQKVSDELVRICREEITPPLVPLIDRVSFDNGRRIVALEIDPKRRPYRTRDGRYYIRVGSEKRETTREELSSLLDESRPIRLEDVATPGARLSDIDEAHLWSFIRSFEGDAFVESTSGVIQRAIYLNAIFYLPRKSRRNYTDGRRLAFIWTRRTGPGIATAVDCYSQTVRRRFDAAPEIEMVKLTGNLYSLYEAAGRFISRTVTYGKDAPNNCPPRIRPIRRSQQEPTITGIGTGSLVQPAGSQGSFTS